LSEVVSSISWDGGFRMFRQGLTRAAWVLVRALVVGLTSSVVNVCNGASAALTSVSSSSFVDSDFGHPRGLFETIAQGIAGLVILPYRGFEHAGARGFAIGAIKGGVGVIARPLSGVLKLVARVTDSLRGAVDPTSKVRMDRARTPRFLRAEQPLGEFDEHRAEGEAAIWRVGLTSDVWVDHLICSDKNMVVLTETRLVVLSRFNQELLGMTFTLDRQDLVTAIVSTSNQHQEVILFCIPSQRDVPQRNTYWNGLTMLRASERRRQQRRLFRFAFDENLVRCGSAQKCEELVKMVQRWLVGAK